MLHSNKGFDCRAIQNAIETSNFSALSEDTEAPWLLSNVISNEKTSVITLRCDVKEGKSVTLTNLEQDIFVKISQSHTCCSSKQEEKWRNFSAGSLIKYVNGKQN